MREPMNNRSPSFRGVVAAWIVCLLVAGIGIAAAGEFHNRHITAQPTVASVNVPPRHFGQIRNPATFSALRATGTRAQSRQTCLVTLAAEPQNHFG